MTPREIAQAMGLPLGMSLESIGTRVLDCEARIAKLEGREQSRHDNQEQDVTASPPNMTTDTVGEKIERLLAHCDTLTILRLSTGRRELRFGYGNYATSETLSEALDAALAKVAK